MKVVVNFFLIAVITVFYISCRKDLSVREIIPEKEILNHYLSLPESPFNYSNPDLPLFFSDQFIKIQNNTPADNPVTNWGATLGRVLFYDTRVSKNNTISCSSCHIQQFGFTDTAQFSKGFEGGPTRRHSMSLVNATYYSNGRFFWDERAGSLEEQVLKPIQDAVEMGTKLDDLEKRLQSTAFYPILFKYAFGDSVVRSGNISKALAQFVRSMISYQSKYDDGRAKVASHKADFPNFTTEENTGKDIFFNNPNVNCSGCHNTDVFVLDNPRNNGIALNNIDSGIFIHTQNTMDIGKFKAPSLKNIALRGRYMNDGSFVGLESVLNHYNGKIQPNQNLDPHLIDINHNPLKMNLSVTELKALQSFLLTLTDKKIIVDTKFSSPFR